MGAGWQRWWRDAAPALPPVPREIDPPENDEIVLRFRLWGVRCAGCGCIFFDAHYCEHTHPYTVVLP